MPVVPYKPEDLQEPRELVDAIRARRGGTLLNLDRMLLHSPPFATGWNCFLGAVRNDLEVPAKLRELAICTVAILNGAEYEFIQHAPEFLKAGGQERQLTALQQIEPPNIDSSVFDVAELAVIQLSIEMTQSVKVSSSTMNSVKDVLQNDRHLVEIIGVIATYNMVSHYLVALGIEIE
ncbi:MAG: carboxymuconolactone decarboxylase family protein [Desulfuromusa sp.]|jgi:alkylhydroperoxidase family enzyme|nr:carboxymuconolactone decarboxylase family protein [Desulfuromusa sp.]